MVERREPKRFPTCSTRKEGRSTKRENGIYKHLRVGGKEFVALLAHVPHINTHVHNILTSPVGKHSDQENKPDETNQD